tara:strand:- start:1070 stop:1375 length:306 start_codon:yes stop_codon:yes gene_type:complete
LVKTHTLVIRDEENIFVVILQTVFEPMKEKYIRSNLRDELYKKLLLGLLHLYRAIAHYHCVKRREIATSKIVCALKEERDLTRTKYPYIPIIHTVFPRSKQ